MSFNKNKDVIEILEDVGDINRCCSEHAEALDIAIKAIKIVKDVKIAIRVGNKLLDQEECDHEIAFDIYSRTYNQIEKLVEEVNIDE